MDDIPPEYTFLYPWLPVDNTKEVSCCICGGVNKTKDEFAFTLNEKEFYIRHCLKDDLLFLYPQPQGRYPEALYNHPSYFTGENDMYGLAVSDEKSKIVASLRIEEIQNYFKKQGESVKEKSLLEIGCAYGHTLTEAESAGIGTTGIEYSHEAVRICKSKGLDVVMASVNNSFENVLPQKQFDIIVTYSILEHVNNPVEFLERIIPLLSPSGIFIARVPEMSAAGPWLSLLDHYWHFTRKSLGSLFTNFNLEIVEIFPSGVFTGTLHPGKMRSITAITRKIGP